MKPTINWDDVYAANGFDIRILEQIKNGECPALLAAEQGAGKEENEV